MGYFQVHVSPFLCPPWLIAYPPPHPNKHPAQEPFHAGATAGIQSPVPREDIRADSSRLMQGLQNPGLYGTRWDRPSAGPGVRDLRRGARFRTSSNRLSARQPAFCTPPGLPSQEGTAPSHGPSRESTTGGQRHPFPPPSREPPILDALVACPLGPTWGPGRHERPAGAPHGRSRRRTGSLWSSSCLVGPAVLATEGATRVPGMLCCGHGDHRGLPSTATAHDLRSVMASCNCSRPAPGPTVRMDHLVQPVCRWSVSPAAMERGIATHPPRYGGGGFRVH